ncbi:hypothetical protein BH20ACT6_BH20ACT6_18130 [soil metagenome]
MLVLLVAAGLAAAAGWLLWFSDYVLVEEVRVEGLVEMPADKVLDAAGVPVGSPMVRVDLDAPTQRVRGLAPVSAVEVTRDWPHSVTITVTERQPLAVLSEGSSYRALDRDGVLFRRYTDLPEGLPRVQADDLASAARGAGDAGGAARADALREVAAVVEALDDSIARRVDYVQVSSLDAIELVLRDGVRVQWGSAADSDVKSDVLTAVMQVPAASYDVSVPTMPTTAGQAPSS